MSFFQPNGNLLNISICDHVIEFDMGGMATTKIHSVHLIVLFELLHVDLFWLSLKSCVSMYIDTGEVVTGIWLLNLGIVVTGYWTQLP